MNRLNGKAVADNIINQIKQSIDWERHIKLEELGI